MHTLSFCTAVEKRTWGSSASMSDGLTQLKAQDRLLKSLASFGQAPA